MRSIRPTHPTRAAAIVLSALLLGACGTGASPTAPAADPSGAGTAPSPAPTMTEPSPTDGAATPAPGTSAPATTGGSATPAASRAVRFDQPWATAPLVDVATGETFTVAGLAGEGRTVILETMAIWCSKCFAQQQRVYGALPELDADRVAYVLLDVDPNETAEALAAYRAQNGFTGRYAIATSDVARALAAEFGDQMLNPPAVPMVIIAPDGRVTLAEFGGHEPDEVLALAREHGA